MSDIRICPTCGGKAKYKEKNGDVSYTKVEADEAFKKIGQLKKALAKYKEKSEDLEVELKELKGFLEK